MELETKDFLNLRDYIHKSCGILVAEDKEYLIRQRLEPVIVSFGLLGYAALYEALKNPPIGLKEQVIIAATTNETSFFRDDHPFKTFQNHLLPRLHKLVDERKGKNFLRKGPKIRIWCAASSTGQEPYTLAMLIHEYCESKGKGLCADDFSILATDINENVLAQAIKGQYNQIEVHRGLDSLRTAKYFRQDGNSWFISDSLKKMIDFKVLNITEPFLSLGGFDMVFCRNILIYFDDPTKKKIFDQIHHLLSDEGVLMLGSSESIYGLSDRFLSSHLDNTLIFTKK